ncbi:hypothetical protein J4H86_09465 [Spiractinospora alimapuensis]|uniref:hypothetical protein n=1 Tax=Spiractinospora alimapuensis TaxID=2820884 RepID=UPI001F3C6FDC|nr:hypothetical protein [Spiractinospora alimapuensis]QVQ53911.1 hypothetical protein J4H86_09465 [Spiractinospora alimapuensis]
MAFLFVPLVFFAAALVVSCALRAAGPGAFAAWRRHRALRDPMAVRGRVTAAERLDNGLNGAAGPPLRLMVQDEHGNQTEVRAVDGSAGYEPPPGTEVEVMISAGNPSTARIDHVHWPEAGTHRVWPSWVDALARAVPVPGRFAETDAEVTGMWREVHRKARGASTIEFPTAIRFVAYDGRIVHTRNPDLRFTAPVTPGGTVRVRYDTAFPPRFRVVQPRASHQRLILQVSVILVAGIVLWAATG